MPEKTCSICSKKFSLHEHTSGFVISDRFFVCSDCSEKHTRNELKSLTKTTMQDPFDGMPIGIWLIHEQNKNKTMMTVKSKKIIK